MAIRPEPNLLRTALSSAALASLASVRGTGSVARIGLEQAG
jgi:hypothetical protein